MRPFWSRHHNHQRQPVSMREGWCTQPSSQAFRIVHWASDRCFPVRIQTLVIVHRQPSQHLAFRVPAFRSAADAERGRAAAVLAPRLTPPHCLCHEVSRAGWKAEAQWNMLSMRGCMNQGSGFSTMPQYIHCPRRGRRPTPTGRRRRPRRR